MDILNASEARAKLFQLLEQVNQDSKPRIITSRKGNGVLISQDDWESLQETLYLQSVPGLEQSIKQAEIDDDWVSEAEFMAELDELEN